MKLRSAALGVVCTSLLLSACGDKEPSGQVAARVNDEEITMIDLRSEMAGYRAPDAKTQRAAERAALEQIINRKLLAEAARKQKFDKTPEYAQAKERAEEALLIRQWQDKIVKSIPAPNQDEIRRYIADNPNIYAEHKVLVVDQLRMPQINDRTLVEALQPLNTLPQVAELLTARKIPFQQGTGRIDTLQLPPQVAKQILGLPPEEIFVLPQGNALMIGKVTAVVPQPLPAGFAEKHAAEVIKAQRTREAVQREFAGTVARARREKDALEYAKAFQPPPPPKKAAAAPAAKAAAPTK